MANLSADTAHDDDQLRKALQGLLDAGLETEVEPRAFDQQRVDAVVARLREIADDDYEARLVAAGVTPYPWGEGDDAQSCRECMYYAIHRRFCELPALMLPVEPQWSCTLWRI